MSTVARWAVCILLSLSWCWAETVPTGVLPWVQVKQKVAAYWQEHYPAEKVLGIEQKGGVEYTATQQTQENTTYTDWWGSDWITTTKEIQGSFARQVVLVSVERANKTRARFQVAALYRGTGKQWQFDQITVGPVTELGQPGEQGAPTKAAAEQIFKEAWSKSRPDFTVSTVTVLAAPKLGQSGDKRWANYQLAIDVTGTDKAPSAMRGKRYRCTPPDYASVLKHQGDAWVADTDAIVNVNESSQCDPAK